MLNCSIISFGCNCLLNKGGGHKISPFGRKDFTSSASLRAVRSKVTTASQPDALQLKQNPFVKYPDQSYVVTIILKEKLV